MSTFPANKALELLRGESQGFAIDATTEGGSIAVKDTTTRANNHLISGVTTDFRNGLDSANNVRAGAVKLINSGTSPKLCHFDAEPYVRWTPHNLVLQSQTFGTTWTLETDGILTSNAAIAPDGTWTADKIASESGTTANYFFQSISLTADLIYTVSVYAKAAGLPYAHIYVLNSDNSDAARVWGYNLSDGSQGEIADAGDYVTLDHTITDAGNGWYRITLTFLAATSAPAKLRLYTSNVLDNFMTGDNVSGAYFWGAQINRGPIATPYLATTTAARIGIPQTYDAVAEQYGILVEPAATNLSTRSGELDNASHFTTSNLVAISANDATAPTGVAEAETIVPSTGNTTHGLTAPNVSYTSGTAYTFSLYAKPSGYSFLRMAFSSSSFSATARAAVFDVTNGLVKANDASTTANIVAIGNGWYRCDITATANATAASQAAININNTWTSGTGNVTYAGDGTSGIALWGWQIETGSVATSYIPTLGSTVTRATDDVYAALTSLPSYSSLSLHSQIKVLGYGTSGPAYITSLFKAAGHGANDMQLYAQGPLYLESWSAGGNEATQGLGTMTAGTLQRIGWRLATNNTNIFLDGVAGTNDPACAMPVTPDYIAFFNNAEAGRNGPVLHYDMALLPRAATDGELQWMTAGDTHLLASLLLDGENNGLACDFTESTGVGAVSVKDQNTPANILYNTAADNFWSNAGTSPKQIHHTSSPYVRWAPHNMLVRSQEFGTTWTVLGGGGGSVSSNTTTAPDGTSTADSFTSTAVNSYHVLYQGYTGPTVGFVTTYSVYAKPNGWDWIELGTYDSVGFGNGATKSFNISSGTAGTTRLIGAYSLVSSAITSVGSGWYRCEITVLSATNAPGLSYVAIGSSDAFSGNFVGNGTSGAYVWGAQLVRGSTALTYLPTTSASRMGVPISYDAAEAQFGALVEPAGTNLCLRSEKFNTSPWAPYQATVTENAVTAPDGTTTASTLTGNANNDTHEDDQFGISIGTATYTASIYLKAGNNNYACFGNASDGNDYAAAIFDLTDGSVGTTASGAGGEYTFISASSVSVGSGWYRCILTYSHTGSVDNSIAIGLSNVKAATIGGGGQVVWAAANGKTIHMWGAQVETGTIATSYIPTLAATVTRAKDDLRVLTSTFKWDDTNDSIVFKWRPLVSTTGTDYNILSVRTDDSNRIHIYNPTSLNIRLGSVGGSAGTNTGSVNMVVGTAQAVGVGLATNDVANVVNGGAAETDSTFGIPAGLTTVYLGGDVNPLSTATMYAYSLIIVPRRMSDTELQARTT